MTATLTANRLLVIAGLWLGCLGLVMACSNSGDSPADETASTSIMIADETPGTPSTPEGTTSTTRTPNTTPTPSPTATPDLGLILPDLETTDSDDIYISVSSSGVKLLHFSTEVHNTGPGALQVIGSPDDGDEQTTAWQLIETRNAGTVERNVGVLQVNEQHGHWHLDDFATYELWTHGDDGELEAMVAWSEKVTFCLLDEFPLVDENYGDGPSFDLCDPHDQGISPGWGETYEAWLPGQTLDITNLPDGRYALRTVLDPGGLVLELDTSNNIHVMYLVIEGTNVEPAPVLAEESPAEGPAGAQTPL